MGDPVQKKQISLPRMAKNFPRFNLKWQQQRQRSRRHKISVAVQLQQISNGQIDLHTPSSILTNVNLKELINLHTFSLLSDPALQSQLIQLLPKCDQIVQDGKITMSSSALGNEFFTKACNEWKERLSDGEFIPEAQSRRKHDQMKEVSKMDLWKAKHFENDWGEKLFESSIQNENLVVSTPLSRENIVGSRTSARLQSRSLKLKSNNVSQTLISTNRLSRSNLVIESDNTVGGDQNVPIYDQQFEKNTKDETIFNDKIEDIVNNEATRIRRPSKSSRKSRGGRIKNIFDGFENMEVEYISPLIPASQKSEESNIDIIDVCSIDNLTELPLTVLSQKDVISNSNIDDGYHFSPSKIDDFKTCFKRHDVSMNKNTNKRRRVVNSNIKMEVKAEIIKSTSTQLDDTDQTKLLTTNESFLQQTSYSASPPKIVTRTRTLAEIKEKNKARLNAKLHSSIVLTTTPNSAVNATIYSYTDSTPIKISTFCNTEISPIDINKMETETSDLSNSCELSDYKDIVTSMSLNKDINNTNICINNNDIFSKMLSSKSIDLHNFKNTSLSCPLSNMDNKIRVSTPISTCSGLSLNACNSIGYNSTLSTFHFSASSDQKNEITHLTTSSIDFDVNPSFTSMKLYTAMNPCIFTNSVSSFNNNNVSITISTTALQNESNITATTCSIPIEQRAPIPKFRLLKVSASNGHVVYKLESVPKTTATEFTTKSVEQDNSDVSKENEGGLMVKIRESKWKCDGGHIGTRGVMGPLFDYTCNSRAMIECKGCGAICHKVCLTDLCVLCNKMII